MKVAILNRDPHAHPGGDVLSIRDIVNALRRRGVDAEYVFGHWVAEDLRKFDLVHIRHCNFGWSWFNLTQTWESGQPYVLTPMFYPSFNLGMDRDQIFKAVSWSKAVAPFSRAEWNEMQELVGVHHDHVAFIPNGTLEEFHCSDVCGGDGRRGVLCVSARKGDKKSELLEWCCKEGSLPLTLACGVEPEDMPDLYKSHKVFINASDSERMSRTIGEGLCAGCRVLATRYNRGNEWYGTGLSLIDHERPDHLLSRLLWAHNIADDNDWNYEPNRLARALTWDRVAEDLMKLYEEVLR